jgi:hypothetical protein
MHGQQHIKIIYFIIIVDMARIIVAFGHFTNAPKKAPYMVMTSDGTSARVCKMLPRCYYSALAGVEEEDSSVLGYGATYWGKWFLTFRAVALKLISHPCN